MLKKVARSVAGKTVLKFRFDVHVVELENLPVAVKQCRVVWSRSAKVQLTDVVSVNGGSGKYNQDLTQVASMYKDAKGQFEPKEYSFKIQVPAKGSMDKMITIGKADVDMARYVTLENTPQNAMFPISLKVGQGSTGYLKVVITTHLLKKAIADDAMTDVSGMTGITTTIEGMSDQDLAGFDDDESHKRVNSPTKGPGPTSDPRKLYTAERTPSASSQQLQFRATKDSDDVSLMSTSSEDSPRSSISGEPQPVRSAVLPSPKTAGAAGTAAPTPTPNRTSLAIAGAAATPNRSLSSAGISKQPPGSSSSSSSSSSNAGGQATVSGRAEVKDFRLRQPASPAVPAAATAAATAATAGAAAAATAAATNRAQDASNSYVGSRATPAAVLTLATTVASGSGEDSKAARAENEKLRAQIAALRDKVAELDDQNQDAHKRMGSLAKQRDEYKEQLARQKADLKNAAHDQKLREQDKQHDGLQKRMQELEDQLSDALVGYTALERERDVLKRQLQQEVEEKDDLDSRLKGLLEESRDDAAQETVAAYEVKYNRLKDIYRELEESSRQEAVLLQQQLRDAQDRVEHLERQAACYEDFRERATKEHRVLEETLEASTRAKQAAHDLMLENEELSSNLVACKLELAQLSEREIIGRRELYKAKATNMKLASKMTKLETLLYTKDSRKK